MKRALAIAGLVAGVMLVLWAVLGSESDEEKIRAQLERLEAAVRVEGEAQNPVFRIARLNQEFEEIFTQDVGVSIPELSTMRSGRKPLAGLAARATTYAQSLEVDFTDLEIEVGTGLANVRGRAKLDATRPGGGYERDERAVSFRFVERDGDWLIDSVSAQPKNWGEE